MSTKLPSCSFSRGFFDWFGTFCAPVRMARFGQLSHKLPNYACSKGSCVGFCIFCVSIRIARLGPTPMVTPNPPQWSHSTFMDAYSISGHAMAPTHPSGHTQLSWMHWISGHAMAPTGYTQLQASLQALKSPDSPDFKNKHFHCEGLLSKMPFF